MRQKIKQHLAIILSMIALIFPMSVPITVYADSCGNALQSGINTGTSTGGVSVCSTGSSASLADTVKNIAKLAINILSIIVGAAAVIMLIYGAFKYITSGGESNSVSSAKNTLLYAIIGLVIVFLAQVIVHLVLNTANSVVTQTYTAPQGVIILHVFR
ncbi:pilin [Patescibacteria group bacterium]|nr:pilin [Patescibacteria group bacterium]